MPYHVCIDIGGTFTDCLVSDDKGTIAIFKSPTTPGEFEKGFINVLGVAAEDLGFAARDFISQIDIIVHGSTVSTNALVEGKTARAGLIVNHGHADILTLREGPRKGAFEWRLDYPDPYIPRKLTRTVRGRIDVRGREIEALSIDDVNAAAEHFRHQQVESVAVGLLWSVVNPDHELRVREILAAALPGVPVTLSHEINPIPREYRRIIAAAIDASISPIIRTYVQSLQDALAAAGFKGELLLANCLGGMMPPDEMMRRPIYSVMSGPTLAPIAALALTERTRRDRRRHGRNVVRRLGAPRPSGHHRPRFEDQQRLPGDSQGRRALDRRRRRLNRACRFRADFCTSARTARAPGPGRPAMDRGAPTRP